ncbi:MAG: NAD-dependent epimerase/dehydratase family protein [Promethearchaeia archaeon]
MITLVTGANGFIGSNLVRKLLEKGHSVRALVLKGTNEQFLEDMNCHIFYGDVTKPETLEAALEGVEVIYHLAAIPSNGWSKKILKVNFEGTKNVFFKALDANVQRMVYMSSLVVHGFRDFDGADEETPLKEPKWYTRPYVKSKIKAERFLRTHRDKLEVVIIRPGFLTFGPHDLLNAREVIQRLDAGKPIPYINKGKSKLSYVYIENLANALEKAGTHPSAPDETFLIADNDPPYITMRQFIQAICAELEVEVRDVNVPYNLAAPFVALIDTFFRIFLRKKMPTISMYTLKLSKYDLFFQSDKAERILGYMPQVSFKEAIKNTIKWYRSEFKAKE